MLKRIVIAGIVSAAASMGAPAHAANYAPPAGQIIFNLDGQLLPKVYTSYVVSFAAAQAVTNLSFSFREDPAYFSIDNIVLRAAGGPNLVVNGDFEQGTVGTSTPAGFTYLNLYNASAAGRVTAGCGTGSSNCYYDGAVGSYDSITQAINTVIGTNYTLTFDLKDSSTQTVGSATQQNGLAGINMVVYAGALPVSVPEPATIAIFGVGLAALGIGYRRRRGR